MALVGIPDSEIPSHHKTNSYTNKIGGNPDWPFKDEFQSPVCQLCEHRKSLVVQLYCPLELSTYHRTLYVFACPKPSCWNKTESWTVYRCQTLDTSSCSQKKKVEDDHKIDNDDWGMDATDWGDDANDWGDDADDWGAGSEGASNLVSDVVNVGSNVKEAVSGFSSTGETVKVERETENEESEDIDADNSAVCDDLEQMTITEETDNTVDSSVVTETMPSMSDNEKSRILKSFNTVRTIDTSADDCSILKAYYINVFEEPADVFEDTKHVTKLLKDYQRTEGFNIDNVREAESNQGGEKYEKTSLLHKDIIFHKFMKKLALCPEQCIRYEWNGSPLYNSIPSKDIPKRCMYCNGDIVFELQLTPALVNHLKYKTGDDRNEGCAIEFGTVIIFTCKQSCWNNDDDKIKTETVIVLPDPDQHLFK